MSKSVRKVLSILLCAALLFGALPLTAVQAADLTSGTCGTNLTWNYDASTATLTISGTGAMSGYSISPYNDENVTNAPWRPYYDTMQTVVINSGVTSIGYVAFYGCTGLTIVTIPNSVTSIGFAAFCGCTGLTSVTIPNSVTSIGEYAFSNCTGLTSVTIPDSVTSIGAYAFCWVANVVYHGSASGSPWGARAVNGYVEEPLVYADSTKTKLLACPSSYQGEITIPDSVTSIGNHAFRGCTRLTSVTIPDSVTSIGSYAFWNCTGLTSVTIPGSVTSIGDEAFYECTDLTSVTIPASVTSIGSDAFYQVVNVVYHGSASASPWGARSVNGYVEEPLVYADSTKTTLLACPSSYQGEIIIPGSVTSIGDWAFRDCTGLTSVTIGNSVTSIGNYAFWDCIGLTSVTIPNSVTSIGDWAFYNCIGLTSVTIPDSVTSIGEGAFDICTGLTSVTIPDSVTSIDWSAFSGCTGLTSVTIPDSVTSIGSSAFSGCTGLTSVTIGNSVTSIGQYAFSGCTGLTDVFYTGTQAQWNRISIGSNNTTLTNATLHVHVHAYNGVVTKQPTCTAEGVMSYTCSSCGASYTEPIAKLPHTPKTVTASATCTEPGVQYNVCEVCGEKLTADTVLPALGHDFGNWTQTTAPTCTEAGEETGHCSRCDAVGTRPIPATGHTYDDGVVTKEPTCAETGIKTFTCHCGASYTEPIAKLPHTPKTVTVPATCTEPGVQYDACEICGEKLTADTVLPATGHTYDGGVVTKEPTCLEDGVRTYTCANCGDSYTETISSDPDAHTPSDWIVLRQPVACTSTGLRVKMCTVCGQTLEREEISPHQFSEWQVTNAPTCTAAGEEQRVCADCGKTETREVAALGHDYVASVIAPTCVDDGFTAHVCSRCHDTYTTDVVSATGHTCSEWMMFVDPTLTADGVMGRKCTVCGAVLDEVTVPRLAGDHVTGVALSAARVYMNRGETLTLTAVVTPDTAHNKALAWSSSHPETATVTNGTVAAVAPGLAVIIAQAEDSGHKDFCVVQVNAVTPQNGAVIENGTITGLRANLNSMEDYLNLLDESMTIETNGTIGTGTKVYIMQGDTVVNEFETVLFGDVDGDGWYDGTDAYFVRLAASGMIPQTALTEAQLMAADCNHDGTVDNSDVALLEQAGLLLANVDQTLPSEELQTNSVYLEYCSLIDQSIDIIEPDQPAADQPAQTAAQPAEQPAAPSVWGWIKALFTIVLNWLLRVF